MRTGTRKRLVWLTAAATFAIAPLEIMTAQAHTRNFGGSVSIKRTSGAFTGRIRSDHSRCRNGRSVSLYRMRKGRDRLIGSGESDQGRYTIAAKRRRGRYYVRVTGERFGGYGHRHTCPALQSGTVRLRWQ